MNKLFHRRNNNARRDAKKRQRDDGDYDEEVELMQTWKRHRSTTEKFKKDDCREKGDGVATHEPNYP